MRTAGLVKSRCYRTREASVVVLFVVSCTACIFYPVVAQAQYDAPPPLKKSLESISKKSVTDSIVFLASDEMAGRDTPSKELTLASEYVAKRFRAAGLRGGGDNGTFYQTTNIATIQMPDSGITIRQLGQPLQHFGLLSGDSRPYSFSGSLAFASANEDLRRRVFTGPVYFDAGNLLGRRAIADLKRQLSTLKRNGATMILIPVVPNHSLVAMAQKMRKPSLVKRQGGFAGPTLLVSELDAEGEYEIELPSQMGGQAEVHNVIGVLPGSDPHFKNEAVIFTAHLDHIGTGVGTGDTIYNGADDDASGVTAVLTLADAFAALPTPPKRTVIFMTYWGEEKGLLGSKFYADHPVWPLEKTVANINVEMIGRPEPGAHEKCWATGWHQSNLGELMNTGSQSVGVLIFEHPKYSEMLYRSSDNYSLVEKGVIAHSFSAGSLHEDYHGVDDEWKKLDLQHMTRVIQGLFAGSLPIVNGVVTPVKSKP